MLKLLSKNRNFRSLLLFSTFGGIGRGMFSIFMMWAVHALYQNPIYTGIAGFMFGVPLCISFIIGPFVDRWSKVRVLRAVELVKFTVVIFILISQIFYYPGVWLILPAILVFSIASLFGGPALTALLPRIVDSDDLVKANALLNITGIVGGLGIAAGLLTLMAGDADFAWVYGINAAVLSVAVLSSIFLRHKEPAPAASGSKTAVTAYFSELKTGFAFIKKGIMMPLAVAIVSMAFFSNVAYVNFPMFAEMHLGTAFGYILLSALALTGSLIGSFICRATESKFTLRKIFVGGFMLAGAVRIIFVNTIAVHLITGILIYVLYIGLASAIDMFHHVLIQKLPKKDSISRVFTTNTSLCSIAAAIGALVGGLLGTLLEVDTVFIIQGGSYIVIGAMLCLSPHIRSLPKISELGELQSVKNGPSPLLE